MSIQQKSCSTFDYERREEDNSSLRIALDNIQEKCIEWWKAIVLLAKTGRIQYIKLRKILARVFQKNRISLDCFRITLRGVWYTDSA